MQTHGSDQVIERKLKILQQKNYVSGIKDIFIVFDSTSYVKATLTSWDHSATMKKHNIDNHLPLEGKERQKV
jgi:hypothetical protein